MILNDPFAGGYLGVQTLEVTKENFGKYGLREVRGVAVEKVVKDSPAAQAGLQNGDVIVRFNGEEVTSVFKLTRLINETAPDHQVRITVLRGGSESDLNATLGKRQPPTFPNGSFRMGGALPENFEIQRLPMPPAGSFSIPNDGNGFVFRSGANRQIGVGVAPLSRQLAEFFGVADGRGLLVDNVRENSPAARAGLKGRRRNRRSRRQIDYKQRRFNSSAER
jgi:S1-C subfamily serine protease